MGHRCKDRFEQTKDMYDQVHLNIDNSLMHLNQKLETQDQRGPQFLRVLQGTKSHLYNLRTRKLTLENTLRKLSKIGENNNAGIIMPDFGHNKKDNRYWKNIPAFNPKNDTTFDTVWAIILARGKRENLTEEGYKEVLEETLKGEALTYYTKNQHKSLRKIIEILYNVYVTTKSNHQIRHQLDTFRAQKDDTFRQNHEKLKLITSEYFKDLPSERAAHEEDTEIRRRIMENSLVDRAALAAVIRKQKEYTLDGKYFNFVHELLQETDVQREARNPATLVP